MYTLKGMNLRIPVPRPIVATFHKHRAAAGRRKVITQLSKVTSSPTLESQESQCPQEGLFQGYIFIQWIDSQNWYPMGFRLPTNLWINGRATWYQWQVKYNIPARGSLVEELLQTQFMLSSGEDPNSIQHKSLEMFCFNLSSWIVSRFPMKCEHEHLSEEV